MATGLEIKHIHELHLFRWLIIFILLAFCAAAAFFGYRWYTTGEVPPIPFPIASADPSIDESKVTASQIEKYTVAPSYPRYLSIPSLNVTKARVTSVGINKQGLLDVPQNINDVAWYTKSKKPGEGYGSVLIDGHNSGISRSGVFAKLDTLQKGDTVTVERGDRKVFSYEVQNTRTMSLDEVNKTGMKQMMYSVEPDKEGLSLVASSGKWIPKDRVFDQRILVRAVRTN